MKYALVSDFDGTISFDDFFNYVIDKYLDEASLGPWQDYMSGKITHFDALKQIYQKVKINKDEFDAFIKTIRIDDSFYNTYELCKQKNIPVFIVSAGCDYYIKIIMGDLLNEITLITNPSTYAQNTGLVMQRQPEDSPYYSYEIGVNKKAVVNELKEKGYSVVFAGDGPPDIEPAKVSDVVFARKHLLEMCTKLKIKTQQFDSFNNIYNFIKELK